MGVEIVIHDWRVCTRIWEKGVVNEERGVEVGIVRVCRTNF